MVKNALALATAGALLVVWGSASAATRTTTLGVSAVVNANCIISSQNLAFGNYDGTAAKTGTADITVRCSNQTPYGVSLSTGGGTFAQRLLSGSGSNKLQYNLFTSVAATTIWGDGTLSTGIISDTGTGMSAANAKTHTVYGQLPDNAFNQNAPTGSYNDSITVTVTY
ncbi:MAG: spore coat protein U domain-containing protein [Gammaproteobacteria bacterium]|nr:spore coat protein U domain-containing protein [Gammaproteobacteria bacterium]